MTSNGGGRGREGKGASGERQSKYQTELNACAQRFQVKREGFGQHLFFPLPLHQGLQMLVELENTVRGHNGVLTLAGGCVPYPHFPTIKHQWGPLDDKDARGGATCMYLPFPSFPLPHHFIRLKTATQTHEQAPPMCKQPARAPISTYVACKHSTLTWTVHPLLSFFFMCSQLS